MDGEGEETIRRCAGRVLPEGGDHHGGQHGSHTSVLGKNELRLRGVRSGREPRGRSHVGLDVVEALRVHLCRGIESSLLDRDGGAIVRRGDDEWGGVDVGLADCVCGNVRPRQGAIARCKAQAYEQELLHDRVRFSSRVERIQQQSHSSHTGVLSPLQLQCAAGACWHCN